MFLPDPCRCRCAARHLRTSLDFGHATNVLAGCRGRAYDGPPTNGGWHGYGWPGAFRTETDEVTASRPQGRPFWATGLSPEEREKLRQEALEERERYRRERSMKDGSLEGR